MVNEAGSGFFEATIEAATDPITGKVDNDLLASKLLIVPRNSGVQVVSSEISHAESIAKRFKFPFRKFAMDMARSDKIGMTSISSEMGAYAHEFNTVRSSSVSVGTNTGPQVDDWDAYLYGKEYIKNNPKKKNQGLF